MSIATFNYEDRTYTLEEANCYAFFNDEVKPLDGLEFEDILALLSKDDRQFEPEYFDLACDNCKFGKSEKLKTFPFLEYHFYAFGKNGKYVQSSLEEDYEDMSFEQMEKQGNVDSMYIVSVIVCKNCGEFSVEMEFCDF